MSERVKQKMNEIVLPNSVIVKRKKYERQRKFKARAKQEYRNFLKSEITSFPFDFSGYNFIIAEHPLLDMDGYKVIEYVQSFDNWSKSLKMKFYQMSYKLCVKEESNDKEKKE